MIRFQPDTWRDAILRPIAMAAPDSGVYMEIMAPDLRYVALLVLTVATLFLAIRKARVPRPTWLLLAFVWIAFLPWLATTGNGRYFIPVLVVTGPLCVALIYQLPTTAGFRLAMASLLLVVQGTAVALNDPRGQWSLAAWLDDYMEAEFPQEERSTPATYVLISNISYSLVAPLFHPDSRWIGLASMSGDLEHSPDDQRAQRALARAQEDGLPMKLLVPTLPDYMTPQRLPNAEARDEIDRMLGPHRLALAAGDCRMVRSRTLLSSASRDLAKVSKQVVPRIGFWICPLDYPVPWRSQAAPPQDAAKYDPVFEKLEAACPRLFRAGEAKTMRVLNGFWRTYPSSDTKAYVLDTGYVYFKYWRALNANRVGRVEDVLAEHFTLDCNQVNGRSGLPWERGAVTLRRVWFDVSYTRSQQGTIGITRTVRRLFAASAAGAAMTRAVAYHSDGFREVPFPVPQAPPGATGSHTDSVGGRLFSWVTGRAARRLVVLALKLFPWTLLQRAWQASAALTFDALSRDAAPARFTRGDVLVIADVAWNYPAWRAARAARHAGASVLLLVYDLMPIRHPEFCFPLVPRVFATFLREMLRCADAVVCISQATEDDLRAWASENALRLPPTGFFHLGSDAVAGPAAAGAVRPQLAAFLSAPGAVFAAVGTFEPKKNYPLLLRVFEALWASGASVRLVVAGKETPDCLALTRALRSHPQQGRLLMTLHDASDAEVAAVYAGCRALVFPSLFEGFGLPLVEARSRGCRVIASDIPAFTELADEGVTLFGRDDEAALRRAVLAVAADGPAPPPYERGLSWEESAERFERVAGELLANR